MPINPVDIQGLLAGLGRERGTQTGATAAPGISQGAIRLDKYGRRRGRYPGWYDDPEHRLYNKKKGRAARARARQEEIARGQAGDIRTARERQTEDREAALRFVQGLEATKPGELSPYSSAQYGGELENISRVWKGLRESGLKSLNRMGMARSPGGARASFEATSRRGRLSEEQEAYRRAQESTYQQGLTALDYRRGGEQLYDPTGRALAGSQIAGQTVEMNPTMSGWEKAGIVAGLGATGLSAVGSYRGATRRPPGE